jgi:hypothetical protein
LGRESYKKIMLLQMIYLSVHFMWLCSVSRLMCTCLRCELVFLLVAKLRFVRTVFWEKS